MARYTMTLADVLDITGGTWEVVDGRTIITGGSLGLEHYPLFDEDHRPVLNGMIFDHYRNEEIGTETISMFQLFMRSRMNEIMPYFNKLYEAELVEFDPLSTVNVSTTGTTEATGLAENVSERASQVDAETTTGSGARNVNSTTPQVMLSGNKDYASSASDANSQTQVDAETTEHTDTSDTSHTTAETVADSTTSGYQGHAAELLARYRETLVNVDSMVIGALADLFMLSWGTNDSYTETDVEHWYATQTY